MEINDESLTFSAVGSIGLPLILVAGFSLVGPRPLWLPMQDGGDYFNPSYADILETAVPVGAAVGWWIRERSARSHKPVARRIGEAITHVGLSCLIGYLCLYQLAFLLGIFNPILVCALGAAFLSVVSLGAIRKARLRRPRGF